MKPFHFKKFSLAQSKDVFRVGTDSVLLGALATVHDREDILEVGTGCGIISLMIAQRNQDAKITALDISPEAVQLAAANFENSPFKSRLKSIEGNFKYYNSAYKFDLILSNPPYFDENPSKKDIHARQQTMLTFNEFVDKSRELLMPTGFICVIIPAEAGGLFEEIANRNNLFLNRKITVFGIKNSVPKRVILEFGFEQNVALKSEFFIEEAPRQYTEEYLKLTEDFHLFKS